MKIVLMRGSCNNGRTCPNVNVSDRGTYVVQDEAEAVYHWWNEKGQPFITDWRWTITADRQSIALP